MINLSIFRRAGLGLGFALLASSSLSAQTIQNFIAVTPCRVVDTRNPTGPFGGPIMGTKSTRTFPFPQSTCGLPANATAYSVNVTVVPTSGLGFLTIFPGGGTLPTVSLLNDFQADIVANGAIVPAGTSGGVSVYVTDQTHVIIDVNGYFVATTDSTTNNTSVGQGALPSSSGGQNTGVGANALGFNASGTYNTATGASALLSNTTGTSNTAFGQGSLLANSTGSSNTALGFHALQTVTASVNNVGIGAQALANASGSNNTAVGYEAGFNLVSGDNNIYVGNLGVNADAGTMRIGTAGTQTSTYVAGIFGVNVTGGVGVVVDNSGHLGVVSSSRRYKQDIQPMADSSDRLMQLEPVSFHYKQASADGSQPLQYGLIAEQVAAIYPELAVYGKDGQVETLQYQELPALLLNEVQKQHNTIQELQARIADLEKLIKAAAPQAGR